MPFMTSPATLISVAILCFTLSCQVGLHHDDVGFRPTAQPSCSPLHGKPGKWPYMVDLPYQGKVWGEREMGVRKGHVLRMGHDMDSGIPSLACSMLFIIIINIMPTIKLNLYFQLLDFHTRSILLMHTHIHTSTHAHILEVTLQILTCQEQLSMA